ncbi:MAG: hypothetical protein JNL19_01155 [Burkholderiales bacterium]|nr:hypothetical protein [Burkholderiales bacterium]
MVSRKNPISDADAAIKTLDLLQELVWALQSRESSDLLSGVSHLRQLAMKDRTERRAHDKRLPVHARQRDLKALVGSMPLVLADAELFPSNEDIAKFAVEALQISIARWEKRSRYEMIGMLVMESMNASPQRLREVGRLLNKISDESESMAQIKLNSRQTGFTWNEAIRSLSTSVE